MDYSNNDLFPKAGKRTEADEYTQIRIKGIERQFKTTFPKWLYDFAMTVSEPIKVYAWFLQSKKYKIEWDEHTRVMNFIGYGHKQNYQGWAIEQIKKILGRELFDHFGKISFAIDGVVQK